MTCVGTKRFNGVRGVVAAVALLAASAFAGDLRNGCATPGRSGDDCFRDGERVVCYGDSITHNGRYHELLALYCATRFPERKIAWFNAGESGGTAWSGLNRIGFDAVTNRPTKVIVMFGMNDVRRDQWPRVGATEENIRNRTNAVSGCVATVAELARRLCTEAGAPEIVHLTPSPFDEDCLVGGKRANIAPNAGLAAIADGIRRLAAKEGRVCVDLQSDLAALNAKYRADDPSFSFMRRGTNAFDRIHPRRFGHFFFLHSYLKAVKAPGTVSTVGGNAKGGAALAFSALEKSLPFPFDEETRAALFYCDFQERFNRERLVVSNLAPGTYEVLVDGAPIGTWSAGELAHGVELSLNEKTPQYAQAQKVRELNERAWALRETVRNCDMWRYWHKARYPVDDRAAYEAWFGKTYPNGAEGWNGFLAKTYLENGWKREELLAEIARLEAERAAAARPRRHDWMVRQTAGLADKLRRNL